VRHAFAAGITEVGDTARMAPDATLPWAVEVGAAGRYGHAVLDDGPHGRYVRVPRKVRRWSVRACGRGAAGRSSA